MLNQLGNTIKTPNVDFFPQYCQIYNIMRNVPSFIVGTKEKLFLMFIHLFL